MCASPYAIIDVDGLNCIDSGDDEDDDKIEGWSVAEEEDDGAVTFRRFVLLFIRGEFVFVFPRVVKLRRDDDMTQW